MTGDYSFYGDKIPAWKTLEIAALAYDADDPGNVHVALEGEKIDFYGLYVRELDGTAKAVADVPTMRDAESLKKLIENLIKFKS